MAQKTNKSDRRTLYTKNSIHDAYMDLIKEKPSDKISITELCQRADINRGTFYLHYNTVEDVSGEIIDEMFENAIAFVKTQGERNDRQLSVSDIYFEAMTKSYFFKITMQKDIPHFLSILLSDSVYANAIKDSFHNSVSKNQKLNKMEEELLYRFIIGGIYAVQLWLAQDDSNLKEKNHFVDGLITSLLNQTHK